MAERLFQGQIQPQARPIGAFIQPSRNNIANAAQLPQMPQVSQMASLQRAGTSSVAGFNQFEQLASSLAPFSKSLTQVATRGMRQYAIGNIESGYYDTLRNENVRARLIAQENKEAGSTQAATTITALEKVDPVAAELAQESNPWRAVGRNRALAQLAAGNIQAAFIDDLNNNPAEYAAMQPGSGALMQKKVDITQSVLNRFGLTGDELESTYYVTPAINKAWDKLTDAQGKLYNQEVAWGSVAATNASISQFFSGLRGDGYVIQEGPNAGMTLRPGMPGFADLASRELTRKIDSSLALLAGKNRVEAAEKIRKTLGYWAASGTAGSFEVVQNVRIGPARDSKGEPIKFEDRPRYADAYPVELLDNRASAIQARVNLNDKQQQAIRISADQLWLDPEIGPAGAPYGSEEWQRRVQQMRPLLAKLGMQNIGAYITEKSDKGKSASQAAFGPTVGDMSSALADFTQLKPSDLATEEQLAEQYRKADQAAEQLAAGNVESYTQLRNDFRKIITDKWKIIGGTPANIALQGNLSRFVEQDLADPAITALLRKEGYDFSEPLSLDNLRNSQALDQTRKKEYLNYAQKMRTLYQQEWDTLKRQWFEENPSAAEMPQGVGARLLDTARENVRKGEAYKTATKVITDPDYAPPAPNTSSSNSGQRPGGPVVYNRASSANATATNARAYTDGVVMDSSWLKDELNHLKTKGYATQQMNDFANKAGVSSLVMIRRQLDFWEPNRVTEKAVLNQWKSYLDELLSRQSSSELPVRANYAYAVNPSAATYSPRAPGAWLMAELFPSAA